MDELLFLGCGFLCSFIPFLLAFFLFRRLYKARGIRVGAGHTLLIFAFALYIIAVFFVTGAGTLYDALRLGIPGGVNLNPFSDTNADVVGYWLNVVMLLPFGFLLGAISGKLARGGWILLSGAGFSLLIELSQLLNFRATDVDDLILNTLGAILGYLLFKVVCLWRKDTQKSDPYLPCEPYVYLLILFFGRFFLFNEMGLARLTYGF